MSRQRKPSRQVSVDEQIQVVLAVRNRVWQMDFSEFETARGGIWRICAVIDVRLTSPSNTAISVWPWRTRYLARRS